MKIHIEMELGMNTDTDMEINTDIQRSRPLIMLDIKYQEIVESNV
jgi:hypothetical protein